MDKTKEIVGLLVKHHFWVVCGIVLVASLVSWFMAESALDKEFAAQKALVNGKFDAVKAVSNTADHPNNMVTDKMKVLNKDVAEEVYQAWQLRFDEQMKVPQWQGDLSKPFLAFINSATPTQEIPVRFREEYRDFIRAEIDKLFEEVRVRELKEIENPNKPPPPRPGERSIRQVAPADLAPMFEWRGIVVWPEAERDKLRIRYDFPARPTSLQVRYSNEDLWIFRALLKIIAATNMPDGKPIQEHLVANIKQIEALNIGQTVTPPMQFFVPQNNPMAGGEGMDPEAAAAGDAVPEGGDGGAPGAGGEGGAGVPVNREAAIDAALKHFRYVDSKGKPLGYSAPEPFAEFKIMPFQMLLTMDQRKIPELLANCANSRVPVEVRQVEIISTEGPLAAVAGNAQVMPMPGMNMGMGRFGGMPGGEGGEGGFGFGGGMGRRPVQAPRQAVVGRPGQNGGEADGELELRPFDLHVEIRGVIYIFNQPDRSKVGKPPEAAPVEAPAEQAQPVAAG